MTAGKLDLDACSQEPIRIPGGIQPHGALIVVSQDELRVVQASANATELLGLGSLDILGKRLDVLPGFDDALGPQLRAWLEKAEGPFLRTIDIDSRTFQVAAHPGPQGIIVEFEEPPAGPSDTLEALYPRLRGFVDVIGQLDSVQALCQAAAEEVRQLTGFNRVLVYDFDADWNGTVIAEDGDGVLPSYLDLRFPASDIPAQARELYRLNRLRLIPSATYTPVPLAPAASPLDGAPLDLSAAALRSVSPVHLEYMRNMGTPASMSVSLIVEGQLWGLISCHHGTERRVNPQVRAACDFLAQVVALQIGARVRAAHADQLIGLKQVESELLGRLAAATSFPEGLRENAELWLRLTGAGGVALLDQHEVLFFGETPDREQLTELVEWLSQAGLGEVFATDALSAAWPPAEAFAEVGSGLIAASISQIYPSYLLWFRPQVARTVTWAGDPRKRVEAGDERLHPRTSFEQWKEQVQHRSQPWTRAEIEAATDFRNAIGAFVLRRAEERAQLTEELERTNKELESFSYSVSHDLRAPFRHIVGYAELLSAKERDLDGKSRHYLDSIVDAAKSAGRLVDDLLKFSHLGRASLSKGRVDMKKLFAEVQRSYAAEVEGRDVQWEVGPLPEAWGDAALLRTVLTNLVGNALKYSAGSRPAIIQVSGRKDERETVFCISDNGVGFDMAYVGKLFGVFQRLHRTEDFEGTGIGLALSHRVIDRHGGRIEAYGVVGEGARFTFALPNRKTERQT